MRRLTYALAFCLCGASQADTLICENESIRVDAADPEIAATTCAHAADSLARFEACGLSAPPPVLIEVREKLDQNCIGLFHCGEDRIEILSPNGLDAVRDKLVLFGHIPTERLFASVLHHEMAHALYESTPCPFESCIATSEYFAYTQQLSALLPEDRAAITAQIDPERVPHRDSINAMILFMAPDRFVLESWAHFVHQPEACRYWHGLLAGHTHFDRFHP